MLKNLLKIGFLKSKIFIFVIYSALLFSAGAYFQSGKQAKKEVKLHNKSLKEHDKQIEKDEVIIEKAIVKKNELNKLKEVAHEKISSANNSHLVNTNFASLYNKIVKSANAP